MNRYGQGPYGERCLALAMLALAMALGRRRNMTLDEAGRLQELWKTKHGDKPCSHSRMVDFLVSDDGEKTGRVVCKECGAILPDPQPAV